MALKKFTSVGLRIEHDKVDALIFYCVDRRGARRDEEGEKYTVGALEEFLWIRGLKYPDIFRIPGGASPFIHQDTEEERIFLDLAEKVVKAHNPPLIIATTHIDCAAFGGTAAFGNEVWERRSHIDYHLPRAVSSLKKRFPNIPIEAYFVDYDGFWQVV